MKKALVAFLFLCVSFQVFGQDGSVKGFVYDATNGEPLGFVTVGVVGTTQGGKTNNDGFFNITKLPVGTISLQVSYLGYEIAKKEIKTKANYTVSTKIYLKRKARTLKDVVIKAKKSEKKFDTRVGTTKITPKELKMMPSIGGEPDIAQYLSVMPGVVSTGDQGGQLYIRGGSPIQNKILLDGMTLYNPFHSIGLYSVFETDAIRNAEVMSGGFGVEYGDRTSAIVAVTTKDGNKKKLSGKIGVNPILAKVFLEGPIGKGQKENGEFKETSTTFLFSLKHSYLNRTSSALYGGLGEPYATKLPYQFTDAYGKINLSFNNGSKFSIFGFNFDDRVNFAGVTDLKWNNWGLGTNFTITPEGSSSLINGGVYFSDYNINLEEADGLPRESAINSFEARIGVTTYFKNYSELNYGVELSAFNTAFKYFNFIGLPIDDGSGGNSTTQLGGFVKLKKNFGDKLIFEPGLRLQYYASLDVFRLEPRVAVKYNITDNFRFKGSAGMYSQNLFSTKSDKDIVNFFSGFLTGPDVDIADLSGKVADNNIQKAYHFIAGVEFEVDKLDFTVEPWYKNFNQLIALNRYKLLSTDPDYLIETGKAYGVDFTMKYAQDRIYLWTVYSYGYVDRFDGIQSYPTPFDRRHNVNVVASYTAGKKYDWVLSARFNYGSPFPFTRTQAFFERVDFSNGLGTDLLTQNGGFDILYEGDNINGGRLSHYHRLDLSASKKFIFQNKTTLETSFGVSNAYDRQNIFYIDRIRNNREYQLPIFPSFGINWAF